ncbi:MAG TPA: hypothetical protein ENH72_14370 [Pseudomonas sabulinigri]|uniref:UGSC-like domain-containing protein n=1 Tax=marine sediment metagenome TaxID=412755 RepID=A0A0F9UUM9_9ZZZZ|nr:hypothetical protein [Halopseudomonas sabulinigri]HEC50684.1 hypothetical protein [Halopseudomonas sabulinigri]
MNDSILLDPTAEQAPTQRARLARPVSLEGKVVGLLDISKPRGNVFLDRIEEQLAAMGVEVKRYSKPTFTRVAPTELKQQMAAEVDLLVEGLAD